MTLNDMRDTFPCLCGYQVAVVAALVLLWYCGGACTASLGGDAVHDASEAERRGVQQHQLVDGCVC